MWDIETQHCLQTIVGHRCEIWSLASSNSNNNNTDSTNVTLVTGSSDEFIRGYRLKDHPSESTSSKINDSDEVLEYFGCVQRSTSGTNDKCRGLRFNPTGELLAVVSGGKTVEIFKVLSYKLYIHIYLYIE